jgi:hypothetical protein
MSLQSALADGSMVVEGKETSLWKTVVASVLKACGGFSFQSFSIMESFVMKVKASQWKYIDSLVCFSMVVR